MVCCHFPLQDPVGNHTLLNFQETRDVLDRFPNVVLWLNGHKHAGVYALANEGQANQRHHLNLMTCKMPTTAITDLSSIRKHRGLTGWQ